MCTPTPTRRQVDAALPLCAASVPLCHCALPRLQRLSFPGGQGGGGREQPIGGLYLSFTDAQGCSFMGAPCILAEDTGRHRRRYHQRASSRCDWLDLNREGEVPLPRHDTVTSELFQ